MNIERPKKGDLAAAWECLRLLDLVSYELNPLKPIGDGDYELFKDQDAQAVLQAVKDAYENCDLTWLLIVLETLMSPENNLIDQDSDTLQFSPDLKRLGGNA